MDCKTVEDKYLSSDDLKRLYDCGIKTTMMFDLPMQSISPSQDVYNFKLVDEYAERAWKIGFKTLFHAFREVPHWIPSDWCAVTKSGTVRSLSPWCEPAIEFLLSFYQKMHDRYTIDDKSLVINNYFTDGETMFLNEAAFYDKYALASFRSRWNFPPDSGFIPTPLSQQTEIWLEETYINLLLSQQHILSHSPSQEIFTSLHPAIATFGYYGNGNQWIPDLLFAYQSVFPSSPIFHILYTWIQWPHLWPTLNSWSSKYNTNLIGGAEGASGILSTTPHAIQNNLRSLIIAPCHPMWHQPHVTNDMASNILAAQKIWEANHA
jgi:hypothetical protein